MPPRSSRRPAPSLLPRAARGWLVLLLVATFLAAATIELAHRAEVIHAVCSEHGELVHLDGLPASPAAARAFPSEPGQARLLPGGVHGSAHEHCAVGPFRRERLDGVPSAPASCVARLTPHRLQRLASVPVPVSVVPGGETARGPPPRS